ncbi:hypothetical protein Xcel_0839 [Xylanimonas cellulosilytica DSM 15894]|uniref:Uncharacterized protein n=1 Tax=Xylanimonas cellulosilytica (strain DSM 15894 / JCM 12276 / CECT 5975 / KCTC 9989 / LMG 20990 / NBRC 107835 / XIL07) TaxID=446471 RepID=D1BY30_XYLCX|nr:hypothetical protein [Xylanimonas cellulosilytica]ACZ29873.1 hypothetical protein Xcel_0839 [Xylanimonas cellulosilytica DSM 15894]
MYRFLLGLATLRAWLVKPDDDPERGSHTIEHVLWALAIIIIVGIVVLAITNYVNDQASGIR